MLANSALISAYLCEYDPGSIANGRESSMLDSMEYNDSLMQMGEREFIKREREREMIKAPLMAITRKFI